MSTGTRFWYLLVVIIILLLSYCHCQQDNTDENAATDADIDIIDENGINDEVIEEEYSMDEDMENMYVLLNRMYTAITHGDARYFNMIAKQLSNDTFYDLIIDENMMEAIESNFIHILNTMHLVSEISIKINANPMQIKNMNDGLFLIYKSMISFLKRSKLNKFISDSTDLYSASFVNLLFCEGISLSLQFRLIKSLKYLLIPSIMNNTEQYYCFQTYHNIINQSFFHISTKSRASGFVRLFFHLPTSLPVMKHLHINNKQLLHKINRNNPIINQQMIKKRLSDIDVLILLKAAFKLNLANEWYFRNDINNINALQLWIKRSPFYLRHVYYHSVISKLFITNYPHLNIENQLNNSCISMQYIAQYWPIVNWFPIPVEQAQHINDIGNDNAVITVHQQAEFDDIIEQKWHEQQPVMFRNGIFNKWNLSLLELNELSNIFVDDRFKVSDIPYQDLYEHKDNYDMDKESEEEEENVTTFNDFIEKYFSKLQSANLEVMCDALKNKNKKEYDPDISYIFDNNVYWKNNKFAARFNVSELIPKYIYDSMQSMIDDYDERNIDLEEEEKIKFDLNEIVESIIMLKQVAIGGIFTGAQPHFHGPVFNALLKGQKEWIIFPPHKSFQMKQSAIQFFCYHNGLDEKKKEKLTYYTFTQNVGDVVFIPHEWSHAILNTQPSIAVAVELFI